MISNLNYEHIFIKDVHLYTLFSKIQKFSCGNLGKPLIGNYFPNFQNFKSTVQREEFDSPIQNAGLGEAKPGLSRIFGELQFWDIRAI